MAANSNTRILAVHLTSPSLATFLFADFLKHLFYSALPLHSFIFISHINQRTLITMLKLRFLLWILGFLLKRTWRNDEKFRQKLEKQPLNFAIKTADNKIERHFFLQSTGIKTTGQNEAPLDMTLIFGTAAQAWSMLTSKDKNAFMRAIQEGDVKVTGDYKQLFQLQSLMKHLKT